MMIRKGVVIAYGRKWNRRISQERRFRNIPKIRGKRIGIYVLYKKKKIIYIGRSEANIRNRIESHTRDRLRNKWDSFSWFIARPKYTSDLEALLHKIFYKIVEVRTRGGFVEAKKVGEWHDKRNKTT